MTVSETPLAPAWPSTADFGIAPDVPRDRASTTKDGFPLGSEIEGVEWVPLRSHADHRGVLCEVIDHRDPFWREPVIFSYNTTLRPGIVKGFAVHHHQIDRQFCSWGSVRFVLYDGRVESPTFERYWQVHSTPEARGLLRIPAGVWHAIHNWTDDDAVVINFPTDVFDPAEPDKFRTDPHDGAVAFDWRLPGG